jgi:uncharacterized protein (TIGR04255 family)
LEGSVSVSDEASIPGPPDDLVSFERPPLNEVALGVQFSEPVIDDAIALADFWPHVRGDLPRLEKVPALPPAMEEFGPPPRSGQIPAIQFLSEPPGQRYWFISADDTRLVQLQSDRFVLNWRQRRGDDPYPRYRALRRDFEKRFEVLRNQAVPPDKRGLLRADWSEVTYVNHIEAPGRRPNTHAPLSDSLRLIAPPRRSLLPPEDQQFQQRSVIWTEDVPAQPIGRLHITASSAVRSNDGVAIYVVTLVARARPTAPSLKAMFESLDRGRDLVVRTFKEITTPRMHERWGLKDSPK